jgi:hypothetical protein
VASCGTSIAAESFCIHANVGVYYQKGSNQALLPMSKRTCWMLPKERKSYWQIQK